MSYGLPAIDHAVVKIMVIQIGAVFTATTVHLSALSVPLLREIPH